MQHERENLYNTLNFVDYNIDGNALRAYYDANGVLVFVLDSAIDKIKTNVLLVMNPVDGRKWDDVLTNDFGVDLETVRPKKDNKYQKLDIEYDGLDVYGALIDAYQAHRDVKAELKQLTDFRRRTAVKSAQERLTVAEQIAEKARETIDKAQDSVEQLQDKLKVLRGKLTAQRREIGKEPTKQSAAKILRTESQIDVVTEKLNRANKRRQNAQKRLVAASDDADAAREILAMVFGDSVALPAAPIVTDVAEIQFAPVPALNNDNTNENITDKTQVEKMADEEVKPLFDTDPNILDEEIAFKPVEFGANVVAPDANVDNADDAFLPQPLQFTPPAVATEEDAGDNEDAVVPVPVLDSLTSVDAPDEELDAELVPSFMPVPVVESETAEEPPVIDNTPVLEESVTEYEEEPVTMPQEVAAVEHIVAPVAPVARPVSPIADTNNNANNPMPEIAEAPVDSGFRPVSPVVAAQSGGDVQTVRARPTALYYVMLIMLIVLSIFTLWMYQRSANYNLPELGAQSVTGAEFVGDVAENVAEPVVEPVETVAVPMPMTLGSEPTVMEAPVEEEPVVEPVVAEEIVEEPVIDVEPVVPVEDLTVPVTDVEPEPEPTFLSDEVVDFVSVNQVPDVVVNKPEYSVSPQDKPVVLVDEYDEEPVNVVGNVPVVEYGAGATVQYDAEPEYYAPEDADVAPMEYYEQDTVVETESVGACADGSAPDMNGCCPGENFMVINGRNACCDEMSGDCFPPIL